MGQKIRHLNKLKEENNKLKIEKIQACDDLKKVVEHNERLQRVSVLSINSLLNFVKKVDELMIREENSRGSYNSQRENNSFGEVKNIQNLGIDLYL